jgi:hypothetical protein
MNRKRVQSSIIACLVYETKTSTAEIEFNSGTVCQYHNVPEGIYYDMKNPGSVTKFFHSSIVGEAREVQVR